VEPEEVVDADHKGPHILRSEVEKAIKELRDIKSTRNDEVPAEALKFLDHFLRNPSQFIIHPLPHYSTIYSIETEKASFHCMY
jgi:hypothetical protein